MLCTSCQFPPFVLCGTGSAKYPVQTKVVYEILRSARLRPGKLKRFANNYMKRFRTLYNPRGATASRVLHISIG